MPARGAVRGERGGRGRGGGFRSCGAGSGAGRCVAGLSQFEGLPAPRVVSGRAVPLPSGAAAAPGCAHPVRPVPSGPGAPLPAGLGSARPIRAVPVLPGPAVGAAPGAAVPPRPARESRAPAPCNLRGAVRAAGGGEEEEEE